MTEAKAITVTPQQEVERTLATMKTKFESSLPPHIKPEKFLRVAMTAITSSPDLMNSEKVNRPSLYDALMKCAQDGLLPDNREAAIVVYGNSARYMPMTAGILKKVRNSGELASIVANVVYEKDDFSYYTDENGEHIAHKPTLFGERGAEIGVYALAKMKDGAVYVEVMDKKQVAAVESKSKSSTVWGGPFKHEMWKKSCIRRLSKRLPMSTDIEDVIRAEDDTFDLSSNPPATPVEAPKPASRMQAAVAAKQEPKEDAIDVTPEQQAEIPI